MKKRKHSAQKQQNNNDTKNYVLNMAVLKEKYPHIADLMKRTELGRNYEVHLTGNSIPNLWSKQHGSYYYEPSDPIADATNQLSQLGIKNARLAVLLGIGLGYELKAFGEQYVMDQNTEYILIIEKDPEIFKAAITTYNLTALLSKSRVHLMVGEETGELYPALRIYTQEKRRYIYAKASKFVYLLTPFQYDKAYYMSVIKAFRDAMTQAVMFYGNDPKDSLVGLEHMMVNLEEIINQPGINLLYDSMNGKPAVVVSSGPSLNKNKHLLKGLEEKALIICPDTSLKILIDLGVKPHIVTSLERTMPTVKLMNGFTEEQVKEVYYAAAPVVPKEAYEVYPGPKIAVFRDYGHFKWLPVDKGILPIQGSSGNMAFQVAEAMGCDPIILIGQDLAFSRDGKTHASGTNRGEGGEKVDAFYQIQQFEVMGNDGLPILTTEIWYRFLKAYEQSIAGYKGTCINSTEGGAFIEGTTVIPFQQAIDQYMIEPFYPLKIIKQALSIFNKDDQETVKQAILHKIEEAVNDLQKVIDLCEEGILRYNEKKEQLESLDGLTENIADYGSTITEIEAYIMEPFLSLEIHTSTFKDLLMHVMQSFYINFDIDINEIPEKHESKEKALLEITLLQDRRYVGVQGVAKILHHTFLESKKGLLNEASKVGI